MKKLLVLFFIIYLRIHCLAQSPVESLKSSIIEFSNDSALIHGQLAVSVRNINDGKSLININAEKTLMPASNLKLVTTGAALGLLGENFKYTTSFEYDGVLKDGTLTGDIYIKGSGDPTLGSKRMEGNKDLEQLMSQVFEKMREKGIHKINGKIIADASIYEANPTPDFWTWGDMGNYYGAGAAGINVNENTFKIYFKPGKKIGEKAIILKTDPLIPNIEFINDVTIAAAGTGDQASMYGGPFSTTRYISGTIPISNEAFSIKGSIPDPGYFFAYYLNKFLKSKGIEITGNPKMITSADTSSKKDKAVIYLHSSPSLSDIVFNTNTFSLNLYAESILKMIGYKIKKEGTTLAGTRAVKEYWKKEGLDTLGLFIYDGSGLSGANGISTSQLSHILYLISKETYYQSFYNSLAIAGVSGTLAKLCKGSFAENNLRAKSGTINKVLCYTGYVKTKSEELLSFSIMSNNFEGRNSTMTKKLEKIMVLISEL